jgi:hypothetical protein
MLTPAMGIAKKPTSYLHITLESGVEVGLEIDELRSHLEFLAHLLVDVNLKSI